MVIGLVICLLVWLNGLFDWLYVYWIGYMVIGLVILLLDWLYSYWLCYMVTGVVMWLLVRLYGYGYGYMVIGVVIDFLYGYWLGYWFGYMGTRLVISSVIWLLV